MTRRWKVKILPEASFSSKPEPELFLLHIESLTKAQMEMIRCMLEIDYEIDPVADWGFKKKDGDLQNFRMQVGAEISKKGF